MNSTSISTGHLSGTNTNQTIKNLSFLIFCFIFFSSLAGKNGTGPAGGQGGSINICGRKSSSHFLKALFFNKIYIPNLMDDVKVPSRKDMSMHHSRMVPA